MYKGEPTLVGSTVPRYGEKASHYSAVCLEAGQVKAMELMRANHAELLIIMWDNGPAHGGDALRAYLVAPDIYLRLVRPAAYSPVLNPDGAIGGWIREEVTANKCFGTKAKVRQHIGRFFRDITQRTDEVKRRCRRTLQAQVDTLATLLDAILHQPHTVILTTVCAVIPSVP